MRSLFCITLLLLISCMHVDATVTATNEMGIASSSSSLPLLHEWSQNYTIMSWNILACRWLDPTYYTGSYPSVPISSLNTSIRLERIVETIHQSNPDILFMQEVGDEPNLFLPLKLMGYQVFFATHLPQLWRDWDIPTQVCYSRIVGNVIAVRASLFRITYEHIIELSDDGDRAPLIHVQDRNGKNLTMVAVHLATDRIPSEQQIDYLLSILPHPPTNVIVGGDFNGDLTERIPMQHAVSHKPTHPYCDQSPYISLDHIYVGSDFFVSDGRVHSSNATLDCAGQVKQLMVEHGSDHYPVSAVLRWKEDVEKGVVAEEDASIFSSIEQPAESIVIAEEDGEDEDAVAPF